MSLSWRKILGSLNAILVSQSVTAILALAEMVPLATKQFDLSIGYHLGMAQVLIVGLQVQQGLGWPVACALILLALAGRRVSSTASW